MQYRLNREEFIEERNYKAYGRAKPVIKKTKTRWPIYFGPDTVDINSCRASTVRGVGLHGYNAIQWSYYHQCKSPAKIKKGDLLYCRTHDPDIAYPKNMMSLEKLERMGAFVPEKIWKSVGKPGHIEDRSASTRKSFFKFIPKPKITIEWKKTR